MVAAPGALKTKTRLRVLQSEERREFQSCAAVVELSAV